MLLEVRDFRSDAGFSEFGESFLRDTFESIAAEPATLSFTGLKVLASQGTYHHAPGQSGSVMARNPILAAALRSAWIPLEAGEF